MVVVLLTGSERGSGLPKATQQVSRGAGTQPFSIYSVAFMSWALQGIQG